MNYVNKLLAAPLLYALLAIGSSAQAGVITFDPNTATIMEGQTFEVKLVGRNWIEGEGGTYGGGVSVYWNPSLLMLESYDTSVFGGDKSLATSNTTTIIDNNAGALKNLSVASLFSGVSSPDFDIAILIFKGLAVGDSLLSGSLGQFDNGFDNIWTDSSFFSPIQVYPQFVSGNLTVTAVPLPAAVWLFGAGIIGLMSSGRIRKSND